MPKDYNIKIGKSKFKQSYLTGNATLQQYDKGGKLRKCHCGIPLDVDEEDECKFCKRLKYGESDDNTI